MTERYKWLQFFADGAAGSGEGGDGAATGVDSGTPGRTPEELGIPSDKAERFLKAQSRGRTPTAEPQAAAPPDAEEAPAAQQSAGAESEAISWEDFFARPENKERMRQTIQERLERATRSLREEQERNAPMMTLLGEYYGVEKDANGAFDPQSVIDAVLDDDQFYEKYASKLGVSNDVGKRMAMLERKEAENEAARSRAERDEQLRSYFYGIAQQGEKMREIYPDFDLQREMTDPRFYDMIDPDKPAEKRLSVKEAFWALHGEDLAERQAEALAKTIKLQVANSIQAGQGRPQENGGSTAPAMQSTADMRSMLRNMSREDRRAWIMARRPPAT